LHPDTASATLRRQECSVANPTGSTAATAGSLNLSVVGAGSTIESLPGNANAGSAYRRVVGACATARATIQSIAITAATTANCSDNRSCNDKRRVGAVQAYR
jgi:hypothetical protein